MCSLIFRIIIIIIIIRVIEDIFSGSLKVRSRQQHMIKKKKELLSTLVKKCIELMGTETAEEGENKFEKMDL